MKLDDVAEVVKDDCKMQEIGGLKMYDLGGLRTDRC